MARQTLTVQLMHAQSEITRLTAALEEAYVDMNEMHKTIERLTTEIHEMHKVIGRHNESVPTPAPRVQPARRELPLHFQRARELAMASGRSVRVGA